MRYLFSSLVQIALLRKDPSVLPPSIVLFVLLAAAYCALNVFLAWINHGPRLMYFRGAAELALALGLFWVMLAMSARRNRYRQTMNAIFGVAILLSPLGVMVYMLRWRAQTDPAVMLLMLLGSAILASWFVLVVGHILRSAIQTGFVSSIALALSWVFADWMLAQAITMSA